MISDAEMEYLIQAENKAFGYVYKGETCDEPYIFEFTAENASSFIMSHPNASEIVITDCFDQLLLSTFGPFVCQCPDHDFLREIQPILIPMQTNEKKPSEFPCVKMSEMDEFLDAHCPEL